MDEPKKVFYTGYVADTYDSFRGISEGNLMERLELIFRIVGQRKGRKIDFLDIGCGTGRYTIPIATRLGYNATGADISEDMLNRAMEKEGADLVRWDFQDADRLSYSDNSFDCVFMSYLLHHISNPQKAVEGFFRILRPEGVLINRYAAKEDLLRDAEHTFFRESMEIDIARVLTKLETENILRGSGFHDVSSVTMPQKSFVSGEERLRAVKQKFCSVLHLLREEEFQNGLEIFEKYVEYNPDAEWLTVDYITFTSGRKPKLVESL